MIEIAAYTDADFAGVDTLWRRVFPDDPPHNRAAVAIPAKLAVQPELFLIARKGAAIVGTVMAGYDGHRGWLYALAVDAGHRRQGIGAQLVRATEAKLAVLGCAKLNLQVRLENAAVSAFYEKLGYAVEPRVSMGKRLG